MKPELISQSPVTMSEIKEELKKIKKRSEELNFRSAKTDEYINCFELLSSSDVKELKEKIMKLDIARLKEEHIAKILDIMPKDVEQLKTIFQGQVVTLTQENMKKIVDIINKQ